jgi:sec-independent protein translocase protein TatA
MGLGGISIWQLLIILAIVLLVFGTKRLKTLGGDLGSAIKGFRKAMDKDEEKSGAEKDDDPKRLEADSGDAEFAETKEKERRG